MRSMAPPKGLRVNSPVVLFLLFQADSILNKVFHSSSSTSGEIHRVSARLASSPSHGQNATTRLMGISGPERPYHGERNRSSLLYA